MHSKTVKAGKMKLSVIRLHEELYKLSGYWVRVLHFELLHRLAVLIVFVFAQ